MKSYTVLAALAMALTAHASQPDEHNILYGRDALDKARAQVRAADTYSGYFQPRGDLVFVRDYDAATGAPLFTAALHNDARSLEESRNVRRHVAARSPRNAARSPNMKSLPVIFDRASRCGQYCSNGAQCTVSPNCRRCVHANRIKPSGNDWQKVCGP
ncbi:hypothetical protein RB595_008366 [Gaeumannomyces hyphopodioides]